MSYQLDFDEGHHIVKLLMSGSVNLKEHEAARRAAGAECVKRSSSRLLVDLREVLADSFSFMDAHTFGAHFEFGDAEFPTATTIAVVLPEDPDARAKLQHAIGVMISRGLVIEIRDDLEQAIWWLIN